MNTTDPIKQMEAKLRAVLPTLPVLAGNEVVNFVKDRFRFGNWRGNTIVPWKKRASKKKKDQGRAILIQTRRLARSIRVTQRTKELVAVGTDVIYAKVHNDGDTITKHARSETFVRNRFEKGKKKGMFKKGISAGRGITYKGGSFKMPQRQFLPTAASPSPWLNKKLGVLITNTIMKALK